MYFTRILNYKVMCNCSYYSRCGRKGKAKLGGWGRVVYLDFLYNAKCEFTCPSWPWFFDLSLSEGGDGPRTWGWRNFQGDPRGLSYREGALLGAKMLPHWHSGSSKQPCTSLHPVRNLFITPGLQVIETTNVSWKAESHLKLFYLFIHSSNIEINANALGIMLSQ